MKVRRFRDLDVHSLRRSDVRLVKDAAKEFSRRLEQDPKYGRPLRVIDCSIGDPIRFGFDIPKRLQRHLEEAVKTPPKYTDSLGYPPLLEEFAHRGLHIEKSEDGSEKVVARRKLELGKDAQIFVESGSSGAVKTYMGIVGGGKTHRLIVFIPEMTYPLFSAEAARIEADIITIPLDPKTGVVNVAKLEEKIVSTIRKYGTRGDYRYMFVGTTIGNPFGSAMPLSTFDDITRLLGDINRKFNIRMHRITDPTYEPFRIQPFYPEDPSRVFDPVEHLMGTSSKAIEMVTGTFSKYEACTGKRLGYGALLVNGSSDKKHQGNVAEFKRKALDDVGIYQAITLCPVDIHVQMAFAAWLEEKRLVVEAFKEEQLRGASMKQEVNRRVLKFATELHKMGEAWLHPFYYPGGVGNGTSFDPNMLNSFYVLWRFQYERASPSQAARFSAWTLNKALDEIKRFGEQHTPVVFTSDGDMFFAYSYRNRVPQYIRTVPLTSDADTDAILRLTRMFGNRVKHYGMPKMPGLVYPFQ